MSQSAISKNSLNKWSDDGFQASEAVMFAQFLLTLVVVAIIAFLLWRAFGKPLLERYGQTDAMDSDNLQQRIEDLDRQHQMLSAMEQEIELQKRREQLDEEIRFRQTQLHAEQDFLRQQRQPEEGTNS